MQVQQVKAARKGGRRCGKCRQEINQGDPYIHWQANRFSAKNVRCTKPECKPRPSELISSPFLSQVAALGEQRDDAVKNYQEDGDLDALIGEVEEIAEGFRNLSSDTQESFDNMPEGLQQGDTGQLLEERVGRCDEIADELEGLDLRSIYDEETSELPEDEPAEDWDDKTLDDLAGTLQEDERGEDETKADYAERLADAVAEAFSRARGAVIEALEGVDMEAN